MFSIVVVFVILPLVWPESDEIASAPDLLASFDLSADVCALAISPDASRMAAACRDESITLWQRSREREWSPSLLPGRRKGGTRCLAFAPDGKILAAGNFDGTVTLWDDASGVPLESSRPGAETVSAVAFSPDGRFLAAAGSDSRIWLWSTADWRLRVELEGISARPTSLAFSPDGRDLASGGEDHTVRIWDLDHPPRSVVLRGHPDIVVALAFSRDGRLVVSSSLCDHEAARLGRRHRGESSRHRSSIAVEPRHVHGIRPGWKHPADGDRSRESLLPQLCIHKDNATLEAHVGWVKVLALPPIVRPS